MVFENNRKFLKSLHLQMCALAENMVSFSFYFEVKAFKISWVIRSTHTNGRFAAQMEQGGIRVQAPSKSELITRTFCFERDFQCDQIGRFLKSLGNKMSCIEPQMIGNFLVSILWPNCLWRLVLETHAAL